MSLALDLDLTVFPMLKCLQGTHGGEHLLDSDMDSLIAALGGRDSVHALFGRALTFDGQMRAGLYPGAIDVLARLAEQGTAIHVMTHRHPGYRQATERALIAQGLPFVELLCGETLDKPALCVQRGIETIVDDSPAVIRRALELGVRPLALRHPHNAAVIDELGVEHADSWAELGELLVPADAVAA